VSEARNLSAGGRHVAFSSIATNLAAGATPRRKALPPAPPAPAGRAAAAFTVTARRLRIDQGIAQAGVRDADALSRRLETGVSGADLRPGTLTAADLGPS
jgi:hypothetical protein